MLIESKRRATAARAFTRLPQKPVVKTEAEKDALEIIDMTIKQLPKAAAAKLQPIRNNIDVIDITADRQKAAKALRVLIDLTKVNTAPTPGSPVKRATLPRIPVLKIEKRKRNISGDDTILNKKGIKVMSKTVNQNPEIPIDKLGKAEQVDDSDSDTDDKRLGRINLTRKNISKVVTAKKN